MKKSNNLRVAVKDRCKFTKKTFSGRKNLSHFDHSLIFYDFAFMIAI
jgi:hypothetical protein